MVNHEGCAVRHEQAKGRKVNRMTKTGSAIQRGILPLLAVILSAGTLFSGCEQPVQVQGEKATAPTKVPPPTPAKAVKTPEEKSVQEAKAAPPKAAAKTTDEKPAQDTAAQPAKTGAAPETPKTTVEKAEQKKPTEAVKSEASTEATSNPAAVGGYSVPGSKMSGGLSDPYFHLTMDDNAADPAVHDAAAGQRHQTFQDATGDPNTNAHSAPGAIGNGLAFDGVDDRILLGSEFASDIMYPEHDFTFSIWAKAPSSPPAETQYVLSKHYNIEINFNPDGSTTLMIWPGQNLATVIPDSMDGAFHHFVVMRFGENIQAWYDGWRKTATSAYTYKNADLRDPTKNMTLGIRFNGTGAYQGVIDDFRIYDRALTAEEIRELYKLRP